MQRATNAGDTATEAVDDHLVIGVVIKVAVALGIGLDPEDVLTVAKKDTLLEIAPNVFKILFQLRNPESLIMIVLLSVVMTEEVTIETGEVKETVGVIEMTSGTIVAITGIVITVMIVTVVEEKIAIIAVTETMKGKIAGAEVLIGGKDAEDTAAVAVVPGRDDLWTYSLINIYNRTYFTYSKSKGMNTAANNSKTWMIF